MSRVPRVGVVTEDAAVTSREAADEFIAGDPFVANGVVGKQRVEPWNEVLFPEG